MKVLIKKARILNTPSAHHNKVRDVLIVDGLIKEIGKITEEADQVISGKDVFLSAGFFDLRSFSKEPGQEAMETLESLSLAAAKGGYTDLLIMPNTDPVIQTKGLVNYFKNFSKTSLTSLHPAGAVTLENKGESFTEMWDLHEAGALAFTDGQAPIWNADILYKSLQYLYPKRALLMNRPEEPALAVFGQMHEGITSTRMGTKGIPSEAEEIMVMRDLKLLEYADLNSETPLLHFSCISTASAVSLIRKAKAKGLPVSCDVAAHQLAFTDEDLTSFDTNLKVSPPFRSSKDVRALLKGLEDGTIDAIVSDHNPLDAEHKNLEFDLAEFGVIGLQTAFSAAFTHGIENPEKLVALFAENPRKLLKEDIPEIGINEMATVTVFDLAAETSYDANNLVSKSKNSPFLGRTLKGKILATLNKGHVQINN